MARIARVSTPGYLVHVICRFVDREWFFASDGERARYLSLLGRALQKSDWRCVAYCLMSNHIHLAMLAGALAMESWSKRTNSPFARWLNDQHGRLGPVFAERPADYLVPPHRAAEVIAYIHNNPVRAKVVAKARDSSWSSHRAYVGLAPTPPWLDVDEGLRRVRSAGPEHFECIVNDHVGATLDLPDMNSTRAAVHLAGAYEIGTPTLSEPVEVPIVSRHFVRTRPTVVALVDAVAGRVGVSVSAATLRQGYGAISLVKRVVIHAAMALGISISDASAALNISRQRGSVIAQTPLAPEECALMVDIVSQLCEAAPAG